MSIFRYMFDSDWQQRADIEELRDQQYQMALHQPSGASEKWVGEIAGEVKELAATVHVLIRTLASHNLLDLAKVEAEVQEILHPPKRAEKRRAPKPPDGPNIAVRCTRCRTEGMSHDMVRAGADWFCRPCAKNP